MQRLPPRPACAGHSNALLAWPRPRAAHAAGAPPPCTLPSGTLGSARWSRAPASLAPAGLQPCPLSPSPDSIHLCSPKVKILCRGASPDSQTRPGSGLPSVTTWGCPLHVPVPTGRVVVRRLVPFPTPSSRRAEGVVTYTGRGASLIVGAQPSGAERPDENRLRFRSSPSADSGF